MKVVCWIHRLLAVCLIVPFSLAALPAAGQLEPEPTPQTAESPTLPPDEVLEKEGARIGEIHINALDVFDETNPHEHHKAFHLVNRLHRTTRDYVIAEQLLIKPGDPYSPRLLRESERLLRQNRYLYDAKIRPVRYADGRVDLEVDTQDVWTLNVGGGFGRSGGVNSTHFLLQDTNVLGLGKSLTLQRESSVDRTTTLFRYDDHAVLGSHVKLGLSYSANSDGHLRRLDVEQPFYSLDTRRSAGLTASSEDRVDSLYTLGHITDRFRHQQDLLEVRGGLSQGLVDGWTRRWSAGFTFLRDRFSPGVGIEAPTLLPADHTLSYPWIGFESVEDQYEEAHNVNRLHRTEDFYLGTHYQARLGYSSSLFGADREGLVFEGSAGEGFRFRDRQTLLFSSDFTGLWGNGGLTNTRVGGSFQYYWRDFGEELFYASISGDIARNLDPENQLLLGGDNGLRGYPLRYQSGDGRLLLTLEQRFYTNLYPFRLFHVGAAAFFDAGRIWEGDSSPEVAELGWLRDVGVGLRLSSSRTGLGTVVHLDLAFPLDGDPSIQSMQFLVTTGLSY